MTNVVLTSAHLDALFQSGVEIRAIAESAGATPADSADAVAAMTAAHDPGRRRR